jgi:DNA-binding beta-propeller fold protein YncE
MKNLWIAIAVLTAALCGFLGYKIANRKPVYVTVAQERPKAADVGESIEAALKVDPKLIIAKEEGRLATGLKELRGVAAGPEDRIYVTGDKSLIILDSAGKQIAKAELDKPGLNVGVDADGNAYVSLMDHIEVFDAKGVRKAVWEKPGPAAWITSIAVSDTEVYAADFGDKTVYRCDKTGKVLGQLGEPGPQPRQGKYEVPSPYFDVAVDPSGRPWVAHVGRQRIENYKADGSLDTTWGKSSNTIQGFSGCCNPSHIAVRKDGSFVTSEKGLVRVKIHAASGDLVGVVAPAKDFQKDIHGLDLAVDSKDRILVADPGTSTVRIYVLKGGGSNP